MYTLYLVHDILELHHGDTYQPVFPAEAVVLHSDMELVGGQLILVTDYAKQGLFYSLLPIMLNSRLFFIVTDYAKQEIILFIVTDYAKQEIILFIVSDYAKQEIILFIVPDYAKQEIILFIVTDCLA